MLDLPKDKDKEFIERVKSIGINAGCKVCIIILMKTYFVQSFVLRHEFK